MTRPESKDAKDWLAYADHLEKQLEKFNNDPLARMYAIWCKKLDEIIRAMDSTEIKVGTTADKDGNITENKEDPFNLMKKAIGVMNEARPMAETISWLKISAGIKKEEEKTAYNPIEANANKKR